MVSNYTAADGAILSGYLVMSRARDAPPLQANDKVAASEFHWRQPTKISAETDDE
jgi:hypothetical protein